MVVVVVVVVVLENGTNANNAGKWAILHKRARLQTSGEITRQEVVDPSKHEA